MKRMAALSLGAIVLMTGCSAGGAPAPTPTPTATTGLTPGWAATKDRYEGAAESEMVRGLDGSPKPRAGRELRPSNADKALMATMTCETRDEDDAVQVEVGEGLVAGSRWWIVRYRSTDKVALVDQTGQAFRVYPQTGGAYAWEGVQWDEERRQRAEAALAVALDCRA